MENIIEINGLCKRFKDVDAVRDLSFRVKRGELFAFLGANGAGKSTTISIICGRLAKDSGQVLIGGADIDIAPDAIKNTIGVVFQSSALDKPLTVRKNLESRAALYGITGGAFDRRLAELAKMLDFSDLLDRTLGKLSGGQRRRIDIARALLHHPKLLILDEPTPGLDPQTRKLLWQTITSLRREEGVTVFLTTHYMEEAAEADYVVVLDAGRIAAEGTPLDLKKRYTGDFVTLYGVSEDDVRVLGVDYERVAEGIRIAVPGTCAATELVLRAPRLFVDYEITKGKMDDVFLAITGKTLKEEEK